MGLSDAGITSDIMRFHSFAIEKVSSTLLEPSSIGYNLGYRRPHCVSLQEQRGMSHIFRFVGTLANSPDGIKAVCDGVPSPTKPLQNQIALCSTR